MTSLFAMAGIAEAALALDLFVIFGTSLLIGLLAIVAITRRMPIVSWVSVFLVVISAFFLNPWVAFEFKTNDDPDWNGFVGQFQTAATWWIVASALAVLSVAVALFFGPRELPGEPSESDPWATPDVDAAITANLDLTTGAQRPNPMK